MMRFALLILGSYLVGSIPFGYLIGRGLRGRDIRASGSGNVGATNVLRVMGWQPAVSVLLLDLAKGVVPILIGKQLAVPTAWLGAMGLAAVLGHIFPVFLGFRGGKGVATGFGAFATLAPLPALGALLVFGVVVASTRYVSLGSVTATAAFPLLVLLFDGAAGREALEPALVGFAAVTAALIIFQHRSNLQRIRAREELKLGERLGKEDA
ncbi:MAG: glycerol-3-phosphate 1-O-acyltransferase PlsY [Thermoanaerobaculia bacterium]